MNSRIDEVEAKVPTLTGETETAKEENNSKIKTMKSAVADLDASLNFQRVKILTQKKEFCQVIEKLPRRTALT